MEVALTMPSPVIPPSQVVIDLSLEEAGRLMHVLCAHEANGRLYDALKEVGVEAIPATASVAYKLYNVIVD